ncbi:hypothetical protein QYF36_019440 [Acer negundo]|nr:hypothetical protein QYF36_019440 [Acer negundo]
MIHLVEELETTEEFGAFAVAVLEDLEDEGLREVEVEVGRCGNLDLRETVNGSVRKRPAMALEDLIRRKGKRWEWRVVAVARSALMIKTVFLI